MSENQLPALLARLKEDSDFRETFKGAGNLDAALAIAQEAGFDVSKADWLEHQQAHGVKDLSDEELQGVTGGFASPDPDYWMFY